MAIISYQKFLEDIRKKCASPEYAGYIADFVQQGVNAGVIDQKNLHYILSKLQKIDLFTVLPPQERGVYGKTDNTPNGNGLTVFINPNLDPHRRKQYAFHELAHVIMDGEAKDFINKLYILSGKKMSQDDISLIYGGYLVIEEAIAQEVSEMLVYSSENRTRPNMTLARDRAIPNITFYTNHDFYGLYQPLAIAFSKTLRGIGNKEDTGPDQSVHLKLLCQRAFSGRFANDIIDEYAKDGHVTDLIKNIRALGNVFRVKQATFGVRNGVELSESNLNISRRSYSGVIQSFNELRDRRPRREGQDWD